jgi:hypothetical protein
MKKAIANSILILVYFCSFAQKRETAVGIAFNTGIPVGDFGDIAKTGFGGSVKGLIGVGKTGQITVTTGYFSYKGKITDNTFTIIPVLAGYRQYIGSFYFEPQFGYGDYGYRLSYAGMSSTTYSGAATLDAEVGYIFKNFDTGIGYWCGSRQGTKKAFFDLYLGYNISFSRK